MTKRELGRAIVVLALAAQGCANDGVDYQGVSVETDLERWTPPTWEEFLSESTHQTDDGTTYLAIEGDLPVSDEAALWDIYEAMTTMEDPKAIVKTLQANGLGGDDAWQNNEERQLTYCVATTWPASSAAFNTANGFSETGAQRRAFALAQMAAAARSWSQAANVRFIYTPSQDATCAVNNANVRINVVPWTGSGACSYWPVSNLACTGLSELAIAFDYDDFVGDALRTGIFRHEIGHILGLHHEHIASGDADSNGVSDVDNTDSVANCGFSSFFRRLSGTTTFDTNSIMGYGFCNMARGNGLSFLDGVGIRSLYGAPPAWQPALHLNFGLL